MARVFVSYRRADGRMAVDWIAERLQKVGVAKDVQAAFHDGGLKGGDDFAKALIAELRECDLVIAVIGPHWEGRKDNELSRIQRDDDWVVKELVTAHELGKRVVPVLIDDAERPQRADIHESIDWLPGRHALRFQRASDLDKVVDEVHEFLQGIDESEATEKGLKDEIVVPELMSPKKLAPLLVLGGAVGLATSVLSAFVRVSDQAGLGTTGGYRWYAWILVLYGLVGGVALPVGVLISLRIARHSTTRWKELLVASTVVAIVPSLMILASGGSHFGLAESDLDFARWRGYGNLAAIVAALAAWAYAVGAPIFTGARADAHKLGDRVKQLALLRDGERWGIVIATAILSIGTAVSVALAAGVDQQNAADKFDELSLISVPIVLSSLILIVHRWAVSAMAETHVGIDTELQKLVEPFRSNGVGRMAAAPLADGGWLFRVVLAMPAITAAAGVALYHLIG